MQGFLYAFRLQIFRSFEKQTLIKNNYETGDFLKLSWGDHFRKSNSNAPKTFK